MKQETEALWFDFELQYAQLLPHVLTGEEKRAVDEERDELTQQWRRQHMCLQSR